MKDSTIKRCNDLIFREIDDEVIIISNDGRHMHLLNETAGMIWRAVEKGSETVKQIIGSICAEYDVDESRASRDVIKAVRDLCEKNIVSIESENIR